MVHLILVIAIFGFLSWLIMQIPMPTIFRNIILGLACFALIFFVLGELGIHTGFTHLKFDR